MEKPKLLGKYFKKKVLYVKVPYVKVLPNFMEKPEHTFWALNTISVTSCPFFPLLLGFQ